MAIGALLLRPDRLSVAAQASTFAALGTDLRTIGAAVLADAALPEPVILPAALTAAERLGQRVADRMAAGLDAAASRVGAVVDPALQSVVSVFEDTEGDAAAIVAALSELVVEAVEAAAGLDLDAVQRTVLELVGAVTDELGLTVEVLRDELLAAVEDLAAGVASSAPVFAAALRRLARRVAAQPLPDFDLDDLARQLLDQLRRRGIDRAAALVRCVADALRGVGGAAGELLQAVPLTGFGGGTVGAAAAPGAGEQHAWYATWLLGYKRPTGTQIGLAFVPFEGPDEVVAAGGAIHRRNKWRADQPLGEGDDWTDALIFSDRSTSEALAAHGLKGHVTFGRVDARTMEDIARWTAFSVDALEALLHALSAEEGDIASNVVNAFSNTVTAIAAAADRTLPWHFEHLILRTIFTLATSLEGIHSRVSARNGFLYWLTLAGPDLGEVVVTHVGVHMLRDALLSVLTLLNHETLPGRSPHNRHELDGVAALPIFGAGLLASLVVPRKDYGLPFQDRDQTLRLFLVYDLLVAPIFAVFGYVVGLIVARLLSGEDADAGTVGKGIGLTALTAFLGFVPSLFSNKEGDTAGGTYNPDGADFDGYPDPATSPYRLPWTQGLSVYLGQGNQGLFSHHALTGQTYAFDFGLDQDEVVRAARPGTIVSFRENTADDTTGPWNFVRVRHDVDDAGNPLGPNPEHDRDAGGAVVRTYAEYGHGRTNSVTAAMGATPVAGTTTVRQGDPIMLAGDTGRSFHNHLHMHVRPDDGTGNPDTNRTIPFVFADVAHDWRELGLRDPGVPYRFNSYTAGG